MTPTKQAALDAIAREITKAEIGDFAPYVQGFLSGAIKHGTFSVKQAKEIRRGFDGAAKFHAAELARAATAVATDKPHSA